MRFLRRDLGANLTAVLLLSFGLGTAALLYTALDRLLLHPLHVTHPETLVRVAEKHPPAFNWQWFPYTMYETMRPMRSFEDLAVEGDVDTVMTSSAGAKPVLAHMVSGRFFTMLGVNAETGRLLGKADEQVHSGGIPVVLSHRFWKREFGGSAGVIGTTLFLEKQPFTIVGVAPESFFGTSLDSVPDLWLPISAQALLSKKALNDPDPDRGFSILGRLHRRTTLAQAQAEFSGVYKVIQASAKDVDTRATGFLLPASQGGFALREQFGRALSFLLWGLAALLLMICANVAGLLLVRATKRERDSAVRVALGATRTRLMVPVLVESVSLGLIATAGGLLLAYACAPLFTRLLPHSRMPLPVSLVPGWTTGLLIAAVAFGISLIFGIIPAWFAFRVDPQKALRASSGATRRSGTLSRGLLMFQTAMTLVLLVATGLMVRTFYILRHTSPGFDVEHLVTFTLNLGSDANAAQLPRDFTGELLRRMQFLPGVRNASLASAALMQRIGMKSTVARTGFKVPSQTFLNTSLNGVSSTFFDTLGIPILEGRSLLEADQERSDPSPTVINQAFARLIFPNEDPIGKTFGRGPQGTVAGATNIVVGVAGDSKYRSLREPLLPIFYSSVNLQEFHPGSNSEFFLYVRTAGAPQSIITEARRALSALAPQLPFARVATMEEQVSDSLWQERLLTVLAMIFSIVSILMAGTGLYGLLAYDTEQRRREFGIRVALGAQKRNVVTLLARELALLIAPGVAAGLVVCLLLGRVIASMLYGITPSDPVSYIGAVLMVLTIGAAAGLGPVARATRVDPAIVLHEE